MQTTTSLTIIGFPEDSQLCVIETLDTYLDRTRQKAWKILAVIEFSKTI